MNKHDEITASSESITLGVLGLGHVGLPTALGLAELGWSVIGADDDEAKAKRIGRGEATFYEPGLEEALRKHLDAGRFRVAPNVAAAVRDSTVLFVCVGTPQRDDGSADLSQVECVARTIASNLNSYKLIVEKSTTPIRTARELKRTIARHSDADPHFEVAVNPEFLREGTALQDFLNPDRIVLGVESERAGDILTRIYRPLSETETSRAANSSRDSDCRIILTDLNTAELIKHAANAFLATKVSFINMVADLCEAARADVNQVAKGLGMDPRIGPHFLQAGLGFGGYCLPKDLRAFIRIGEENRVDTALLRAVSQINDRRVDRFVSTVRSLLWVLEGKVLAVWGLAFKPGTDDVREAPSLTIARRLLDEGAKLRVHDPKAMAAFESAFPEGQGRVVYCDSPIESAKGADAVLLVTEWPEFQQVDLAKVRDEMALPVIVDGRNFLDPARARRSGFEYHGMGRQTERARS